MKKQIFLGALLCLYGSMPAWTQNKAFIQNVGQITDINYKPRTDLDFKVSEQKGLQVFVGKGQLHYQWIDAEHTSDSTTLYHSYRLDMQLVGSKPNPTMTYSEQQTAYERYFLSWVNTDNSNEGKVAHRYNSVTYHNVYPNIDWKLYFTPEGQLEYDFIIHPGGKASDIQIAYNGADSLKLDPKGRLNIYTPKGQIIESAPYSYEEKSQKQIASEFKVMGNKVSFNNAAYNGTLVIDPIIEWGTYFGGIAADAGNSVAVGRDGHIYMVGTTSSVSNIATTGSHQQSFGGGSALYGADGIISKWNSAGGLLWATYYGGTGIDNISSVVIDTNNHIIIGGFTNSNDGIATANMHKSVKGNSAYDVFLAKFDSTGVRSKATYHGGIANEGNASFGMGMDRAGNILVVGNTNSIDYPVDANAYRTVMEGTEGFLVKFDNELVYRWNTLVGGNAADNPTTVTTDSLDAIYVGGYTRSTTGIAIGNAHQISLGGNDDGFLIKYDTLGLPVWGTYLGGTAQDRIRCLAINDTILFVGGMTQSNNGIATTNGFNPSYTNSNDGLINLFSLNGTRIYGTYINGSYLDAVNKVAPYENAFIFLGQTNSPDIDTINSIQNGIFGSYDLLFGKITKQGQFDWLTYWGGGNYEDLGAVAVFQNNLYVNCLTSSGSLSSGNNVFQPLLSGNEDIFLLKINLCDAPILNGTLLGSDTLCPNSTAIYNISAIPDPSTYHWILPTGWQGQSDSNSIAVLANDQSGTISLYTRSACGGVSDTIDFEVFVHPNRTITIQQQNNILRTTQVFPSYQWMMNGSPIAGATNSTYIPTNNGIYSLQVIDDNGCVFVSDTIDLTHLSIVDPTNKHLSIYPNPTEGKLALDLPTAGTIQVIDLLGRNCIQVQVTAGKQQLDLSKLNTGTYTLLYTTAGGQFSGLVVKE